MTRNYVPWVLLLAAGALSIEAQVPKAPFTEKDLELGKKIVATSAEIRAQINPPNGPAEPFKVIGNLYMVGDANGGAYLLTSPQGHILLGAGFINAAAAFRRISKASALRCRISRSSCSTIIIPTWQAELPT